MSRILASTLYDLAAVAADTIVLCLGGTISFILPAPIMVLLDIAAKRALGPTGPNVLNLVLPGSFRAMLLSSISDLLPPCSLVGYIGLCGYFSSGLESWSEAVIKSMTTLLGTWIAVGVLYAAHVLLFKAFFWTVVRVDEAERASKPQEFPQDSASGSSRRGEAQANTQPSAVEQVDWAKLLARDLYP